MRKASKKQNRRLKRTVRRTIGALCLISAITIAAIPVPENMAYNPTTDQIPAYSDVKATDSSMKIEELAGSKGLIASDKVSGLIGTSQKTYAVTKRNGIISLDWQFEVKYVDSGSAKTNGFITAYNTSYVSDNPILTVSDYLFLDYAYVDLDAVKKVTERVSYSDSEPQKVSIDVNVGESTPISREIQRIGIEYTLKGNPYTYSGAETEEDKKNPNNYTIDTTYSQTAEYKFFD